MIASAFLMASCGSGKSDKEKAKEDSIRIADSIAKSIVEVESWEAFQLAKNDLEGFKAKFEGKTVRIKNIPVVYIGSDGKMINGLAYSATENKMSTASFPADKAKKQTGLYHAVGETKCELNADMNFTFVIDMTFNEPVDQSTLKARETKTEENGDMVLVFHSLITVESNAVSSEGSSIKMGNCVIKNVEAK